MLDTFRELVLSCYILTKAPMEEKLGHIFEILDKDHSGSISCHEVRTVP